MPDSPIADALLALKHAVVHTSHSANNWMSPGIGQLSYASHCQSPNPATSYQSTIFSTSPIYDRSAATGSPTQTPFPFASSHHHHHHQQQQNQQQQQHRYHSADSQDSSSPALANSTPLYAGGMHRPIYRRDIRDFTFGSPFGHDAPGPFANTIAETE